MSLPTKDQRQKAKEVDNSFFEPEVQTVDESFFEKKNPSTTTPLSNGAEGQVGGGVGLPSDGTTSETNSASMQAFSKKAGYQKGNLLYNIKQDNEINSRIKTGNVTSTDLRVLKKKNPDKYTDLTKDISADYEEDFLKTPTADGIIAEKLNSRQKESNLIASKDYDAIYHNNLDNIILSTAEPVNKFLASTGIDFEIKPTTDIEESKQQLQFLTEADRKNNEQYNKDKIVTKITPVQGTLAGVGVDNTTEFDVSKMTDAQIEAWKDQDADLYLKLVEAKQKTVQQNIISSAIHSALTPIQIQLGNNLYSQAKNTNVKDLNKDYVREIGEQIYKIKDPENYALFQKAGGYDNTKSESEQVYSSELDKINKDIMSSGYSALKGDVAATGTVDQYQNVYDNLQYLNYKFSTPLEEETRHMIAATLKTKGISPSDATDAQKDEVAATLPLENQQVWFNKTKGTNNEDLPDTGFTYSFGKSFTRSGTNILQSGSPLSPLSWATLFMGVPDDKENAKEILRNQMKSDVIGENPETFSIYNDLKSKQESGTITPNELNELNYLAGYNDVRSSWDRIVDGNANMVGMISAVTIDAIPTLGGSALSGSIVKARNLSVAESAIEKGVQSVPVIQQAATKTLAQRIGVPQDTEGIINFAKNKNEMFVLMHHDNTVMAMELFPEDDTKKAWYTGITDVISVALPNILPTHKLGSLFTKEANDIVSETVNQISAKNLDKAVIDNMMKETASKIINKAGTFVVGAEKSAAEAALTMSLMTLGNNVTQAALKPDSITGNDISNNFTQTFSSVFMDSQLVGLIGGKTAVNKKYGQAGIDAIYDATNSRNNVNAVKFAIFKQKENGMLTEEQANEKVSLLETASQVRSAVNGLQMQENLSTNQSKRVFINLMNERILKNQILKLKETGESESLIAPKEKRLQEITDINSKIIGREVYINDKYSIVDKNNAEVADKFIVDGNSVTETEFKDILRKGQKEADKYDLSYVGANDNIHQQLKVFGGTIDESTGATISPKGREVVLKEGVGELYDKLDGKAPAHYLDPLNKEGSINEITHQALTAPQGLKGDLGEPLLLELISRNSVEDINKSIEDWTKVATKEGVSASELNDADRHIKLLEKGLEQKGKVHEESNPVQPTVESAVIEIGGKTYEGKNHAEAILKAQADGQDISKVDRKAEGKFKLSDGTVIDRAEAKTRFGKDRSELLIEQDEAAKQANKDYAEQPSSTVGGEDIEYADLPQNVKDIVDKHGEDNDKTEFNKQLAEAGYTTTHDMESFGTESGVTFQKIKPDEATVTEVKETQVTEPVVDEIAQKEAEVRKLIEDAAASKKSVKAKNDAMAEEAAKHGELGAKILSELKGEEPASGKEPPAKPPVDDTEGNDNQGRLGNKALANRLVNAKNIPEAAKEGIIADGLEYEPQSQKEANDLANSIIDELGIDEAVLQAQAGKFGGDVNTLIQTESLNKLAELSGKEKPNSAAQLEYDLKFAEIGVALDKALRKQGQSISSINFFYKKSPLGVQLMTNAIKKAEFEKWSKPKDQSWKEAFEEMMKEPDFEAIVKGEVQEGIKKQRATERAEKKEKVHKAIDEGIDKWIKKLTPDSTKGAATKGVSAETVLKSVGAAMKKAYDAGESISEVVKTAIEKISEKLGITDWDKEGFKKDWENKLGKDSGYQESDTRHQKRIEYLQKELQRIKDRKSKEPKEKTESTREIPKEEQDILDEIGKEQTVWDAEKDKAREVANDYQKLETERNRQLKRVEELNEKIDTLRKGKLPESKKLEPKADTPEIELLKAEKDALETRVRESIAHENKMNDLEKELQRLKDRKEKEPNPENKKVISDDERLLRDEIEAERKAWAIEDNVSKLNEELQRVKARQKKVAEPKEKRALTTIEKELTDQINNEKKLWAKEVEPERKIRAALKATQKSLEDYERRIAEKDISKNESSTPETPELKALRDRRDTQRKIYEAMKKEMTKPTDAQLAKIRQERILERFRTKLKGLSESQKEEVVREAHRKIIENGGLDYPEFRDIIAKVTGMGSLTDAEAAQMRELVTKVNAVDEATKRVQDERTEVSIADYMVTKLEADKASQKLSEVMDTKPNITRRLTSIMQLNTLGVPALVNNPVYNVVNQLGLRLPVSVVNSILDQGLKYGAKILGKEYKPETNVVAAQKEFFRKLGLGTSESLHQLVTGLNRMDYTQKEVSGSRIKPATSLIDIGKFIAGGKNLTKAQFIDKLLQGTFGVPAEVVARILNLGDKPLRFGAEGAQAATFAKNLGLKDIDYKLFVMFPREEAYRNFKLKGYSEAEASRKADYIKDIIVKEGERATFQQDNFLNDIVNKVFGGEKSGIGSLAKATLVSPYIKIPANAYWSYYNLVNPEVAVLQSLIYGGKAFAKRNIGDNSAAKDLHEARYWLAHAAVGMATRAVIVSLVSAGIFRPANTQKDTKKEREGENFYEQQGTLNMSKLQAWIKGENPNKVKNGLVVQNRWFGHWGTMGNAIARKSEDMTPEQKEKQDEFWNIALGGMEKDALQDLQQGVFANTSALLSAANGESGGWSRYGVNTLNMFANIVHPATMAQLSRAQLPYYTKAKADSFYEELKNSMLSRSSVLRKWSGQMPPSKVSVWGDILYKKDDVLMRLFGFSRANPDNFAQPIYEDATRTNNISFFPSAVMPVITDGGVKHTLNTADATKFEQMVGHQRKQLVAPYVNDMAKFEGSNKTYSELDDTEKVKKLNILYDEGYNNAKYLFLKEHPQYKTPKKSRTEEKGIKQESQENETFRAAQKKKSPIKKD